MADENEAEDFQNMFMPKESECLRIGCLQRKSINTKGIVWDKRIVCLTEDMLMFAQIEDSERGVIDYIHLQDVVECELKDDEDTMSMVENADDDEDTHGDHKNKDRRMLEVIFRTYEESRNCGRSYIYRSTVHDAEEWEVEVDRAVGRAKHKAFEENMQREYGHSTFAMARARWKHTTESPTYQYAVAALILFAFIVDVLDAQLTEASNIFTLLDIIITSCFTIELFSNLFANSTRCFKDFFVKYMNWVDLVIVAISLVGVYLNLVGDIELGPFKVVRIFRVLKVLPMIKKLASLVRLVQSIGSCLLPMGQAFMILFVITLLYCVLGVHLFSHRSPEYFKDLSTALFSLHQVVMGDSWSSGIARSLFLEDEDGVKKTDPAIALYFVSYILIGNVLLLNVVVAVLLDEFLANVERGKELAAALAEAEAAKQRITGVLDPITSTLTNYQDADDLAEKMDVMYKHLDADGSGGLNFEEFREGIKRLPGTGRIHMTKDDFDIVTE